VALSLRAGLYDHLRTRRECCGRWELTSGCPKVFADGIASGRAQESTYEPQLDKSEINRTRNSPLSAAAPVGNLGRRVSTTVDVSSLNAKHFMAKIR